MTRAATSLLVLVLLAAGCLVACEGEDSASEEDVVLQDGTALDVVHADTTAPDSTPDSTPDLGPGDTSADDTSRDATDAADDTSSGSICVDCFCTCWDGSQSFYGDCYASLEEVPREVLECELDCSDYCPANPSCADIDCGLSCPNGLWRDDAMCEVCACAPPLVGLRAYGADRDRDYLTVDIALTDFIGALNRWIFDVTWSFDDPASDDEEETVTLSVAILRDLFEPGDVHTTLVLGTDPLEFRGASHAWVAGPSTQLQMIAGWMSVRRVGGRLVGGLYAELSESGVAPAQYVVRAPFDVPAVP